MKLKDILSFFGKKREQHTQITKTENFEILICVDFGDLITYPNEDSDEFLEKDSFKKILDILRIDFNITNWVNNCYEIISGRRDLQQIELHFSQDKTNYLLADNYIDPIVQIDYIIIGFKTQVENEDKLKELCRHFYDNCDHKIQYMEGPNVLLTEYPIEIHNKLSKEKFKNSDYLKGKIIKKFS